MSEVYQTITNKIIEVMERGEVPWKRPWSASEYRLGECQNMVTRSKYRGINALLTSMLPYEKPYFVTFKQAKDLGGYIRKGEKGIPIVFWNFKEFTKEKTNESGQVETENYSIPFVRFYTVFNIDQCADIDTKKIPESNRPIKEFSFSPIEKAESILNAMNEKPLIFHKEQKAYFSKASDFINMPRQNTFEKSEEYYSTLFHEIGHWTGHESRLNRKTLVDANMFGDHNYSKEELVAELTSAFLCSDCGIDQHVIENQAAYLQNWLKALKGDAKLIIEASQQAQKAHDLITGKTFENETIS